MSRQGKACFLNTSASLKMLTGAWSTETDWDSYLAELEQMQLSALLEMYQTAYARQFGE